MDKDLAIERMIDLIDAVCDEAAAADAGLTSKDIAKVLRDLADDWDNH